MLRSRGDSGVVDPGQDFAPVEERLIDEPDNSANIASGEVEHRTWQTIPIAVASVGKPVEFLHDPVGVLGELAAHALDDLVGEQVSGMCHRVGLSQPDGRP